MSERVRVLLVEDSEDDALLVIRELRRGGLDPEWERVESAEAMRDALTHRQWDAVLSDYNLPRFAAPAALALLKESGIDIPFIVVSGEIGEETAVGMMRAGAQDYIMKGNLRRLTEALRREINEARARAEQKKLEAQLVQTQKLEALGTLAGGIAHDFNNILTAILGFARLGLQRLPPDSPVRQDLQEVITAGQRASGLVKQILTFARKGKQEHTPVQVSLIAREVLDFLRAVLPATVRIDARVESDAAVMCDPTRMHQVLMNLCTNAAKAMPDGGSLELALKQVTLDEQAAARLPGGRPGDFLHLVVKDSGVGMTPEVMARIFEPFFTTRGPQEGTGMGLALVYGIVTDAGGSIVVESEPNKGSSFHVYLPVVAKPPSSRARAEEKQACGKEKILFVDDEAIIAKIAKRSLEQYGYHVAAVTDSQQALELFRLSPDAFSVVITDLVMPRMTGDVLAARIHEVRPGIPVVLCSGLNDPGGRETHEKMGISAFLKKPFETQTLARTIRGVLDAGAPPPGGQAGMQGPDMQAGG